MHNSIEIINKTNQNKSNQMGHLSGEIRTMHCSRCGEKRIHHEIMEDQISGAKLLGGLLTSGLSLIVTGVNGKNNKTSFICSVCQKIKN